MNGNQQDASGSILDREERTISEILQAYRALIRIATERISNRASIGQAAQNSMAMQLETQRLIKGVENLLAITRRIRELWIVGPLRRADEGGREAEETIDAEVQTVTNILNQLRSNVRQQHVSAGGGYGQYIVGPLQQPPPPVPAPQAPLLPPLSGTAAGAAASPSNVPGNVSASAIPSQVNGAA